MAKGGKDVDIVLELENLHAFTDFLLNKNGLIVCEIYQEWAGQCVVMKRFLKKAKFEFLEGDDWDLVTYCSIKVEAVPAFKNLRGKCIPTYLFFGGRKPVAIFRGYEPSLLMPLIKEMVKREKLCMAGKARRHVISETIPYEFPEEDQPLPELEILEVPIDPPQVDDLELELLNSEPEPSSLLEREPSVAAPPPPASSVQQPVTATSVQQPSPASPTTPEAAVTAAVVPTSYPSPEPASGPAPAQPVPEPVTLDLSAVPLEHTAQQEPVDSTATTVIPSPTHSAGEEIREFAAASRPVTNLPKSPSSEVPSHVSAEEPRRIPKASGAREPTGGSAAENEQPVPIRNAQGGATAAGGPAVNPTQVTEPSGPGTANLVPVIELPTVAPSQLDETGNKANAQAAVGMVPVDENPNVENSVFTPADQAETGAVAEISIPGVQELGPGSDQGVAHVLEPATLPDANAEQTAGAPTEPTS